MRINAKNYPLLAYLRNPRNGIEMMIPQTEMYNGGRAKADRLFREFFDNGKRAAFYAEHIDIVSLTFMHAAWENRERIMTSETLDELLKEPIWGVLICGSFSIAYYFQYGGLNDKGERLIENKTCVLRKTNLISINSGNGENEHYLAPRDYGKLMGDPDLDESRFDSWPILFHLFKKYADVETIDAKMGKKVAIPDTKDKLLVEFDLPMAYTDCSWFREIVRREGFMVSGHFRLQWYPSRGEHRLIYIEPFQKHGYTRRAKIDLQAEQ